MTPLQTSLARLRKSLKIPTWHTQNLSEKGQIEALWKGVKADTGHPLLVDFLAKLIRTQDIPARDPIALARALQLYSARKIRFFRERPERFQSAVRTLAWGIGDCDDKARFIAAGLRSMRIPARLAFMHVQLSNGKRIGHVWPQAYLTHPKTKNSKWIDLESVREYPLGFDPVARLKQKGLKPTIRFLGDSEESTPHI